MCFPNFVESGHWMNRRIQARLKDPGFIAEIYVCDLKLRLIDEI